MLETPEQLARKRARLIEQIAAQRAGIARHGAALRPAAQLLDKVRDGVHYMRSHPAAWLVPAAAVLIWRPRRLMSLGLSAFSLWRFLQQNRLWFRR